MSSKVLSHAEASLLLPWLGTDRLAAGELEPLLDHLKVCAACRGELRDLSELGRFAELAERAEAPDAAAIERRLSAVMGRLETRSPARFGPPARRAPGLYRALALAAVLTLAGGLLFLRGAGEEPVRPEAANGPYKTLSSPAPAASAGAALRVVVADGCGQAELRRLLLEAKAEIRGGPTRLGVYTVGLPAGAVADRQIEAWRPLPCFSFVEKAAESGAGS